MHTDTQAAVHRQCHVFVQRGLPGADRRSEVGVFGTGGNFHAFQKRDALVQQAQALRDPGV